MSAQLKAGDKAPSFSALSWDGSNVSMSDFKGRNIALFFYVRDNTPGCEREARSFRDIMRDFGGLDTEIVGVSTDGVESHGRFASSYDLDFPLLADEDGKIAKAYGVLKGSGKNANRATFLIDKSGVIRHVWPTVQITGHAKAVAAKIDELGLA